MIKNQQTAHWPPSLVLPMMLLRENLQQSVLQNMGVMQNTQNPYYDPSGKIPRARGLKIPVDNTGNHTCSDCGRIYKLRSSLRNHQKWECGKEPQFKCPFCSYKAKQKMHMLRHTERMHKGMDLTGIKREMEEESEMESVKDLSVKKMPQDGHENNDSK